MAELPIHGLTVRCAIDLLYQEPAKNLKEIVRSSGCHVKGTLLSSSATNYPRMSQVLP